MASNYNTQHVYKILAKAISIHLWIILPTVIHLTQTRFIQERSILDNAYTFWESNAVTAKAKQKLAMVMLYFEKSYEVLMGTSCKVPLLGLVSLKNGLQV